MGAVFLAVGAYILRKDDLILDGLALALSTGLGAVIANIIGAHLGYGMVGYNRWIGTKLAEELGLSFGFFKDVFLILFVKYALTLSLITILALFVVSKFAKSRVIRTVVIVAGGLIFVAIAVRFSWIVGDVYHRIFHTKNSEQPSFALASI